MISLPNVLRVEVMWVKVLLLCVYLVVCSIQFSGSIMRFQGAQIKWISFKDTAFIVWNSCFVLLSLCLGKRFVNTCTHTVYIYTVQYNQWWKKYSTQVKLPIQQSKNTNLQVVQVLHSNQQNVLKVKVFFCKKHPLWLTYYYYMTLLDC